MAPRHGYGTAVSCLLASPDGRVVESAGALCVDKLIRGAEIKRGFRRFSSLGKGVCPWGRSKDALFSNAFQQRLRRRGHRSPTRNPSLTRYTDLCGV